MQSSGKISDGISAERRLVEIGYGAVCRRSEVLAICVVEERNW